jgi:hypothetical protein
MLAFACRHTSSRNSARSTTELPNCRRFAHVGEDTAVRSGQTAFPVGVSEYEQRFRTLAFMHKRSIILL